jgi:hypothetical protein
VNPLHQHIISAHQTALSDYVGSEDGYQMPLDMSLGYVDRSGPL